MALVDNSFRTIITWQVSDKIRKSVLVTNFSNKKILLV